MSLLRLLALALIHNASPWASAARIFFCVFIHQLGPFHNHLLHPSITQYLAWKFPAYGALQNLLQDVLRSKAMIGKQSTTIYLLGTRFEAPTDHSFQTSWSKKFLFTYRKNFKPIATTNAQRADRNGNVTSDQGWGCYIRVYQMMLAQCFAKVGC